MRDKKPEENAMRSSRSILPLLRAPSTRWLRLLLRLLHRHLLLVLIVFLFFFFFLLFSSLRPASLSHDQERKASLLSLLFARLSYGESRQLRRSRICPSIGAKQAHPLKRYATSLSTHGERERFTSRQYWSNVKPV